jgi:hypothetical protein
MIGDTSAAVALICSAVIYTTLGLAWAWHKVKGGQW